MTLYVKACPRCSQVNPEYQSLCEVCGYFIGLESAQPDPAAVQSGVPSSTDTSDTPLDASSSTTAGLYLEIEEPAPLMRIESGWVLGQAHVSSQAQVQLPAHLAGCRYVHRRHVRFDYLAPAWFVTAIDQRPFGRGFTNTTTLNGQVLGPGERRNIRDGDELHLAELVLRIRILK
ncbi:putative FHA domain-containing protein [Gammaproteobacteria bacterium]